MKIKQFCWTTRESMKKEKGIKKSLDKWNKSSTYQNLWDAAKARLSGTFIVVNAYIKKEKMITNKLVLFE